MTVTLAAVGLVLLGCFAVVTGLFFTWVSGWSSTPRPSDQRPVLAGVVVGSACVVSAVLLWRGRGRRTVVAALTFAVPLACILAAPGSADLSGMQFYALLGWLGLCAFLRTRRWAAWFRATGE